jgi:hypothetical protein
MPVRHKRLRMFAGPNGSGKTSLAMKLAKEFSADGLFQLHTFVNADDLERALIAGRDIPLDFLGKTVTVNGLRAALIDRQWPPCRTHCGGPSASQSSVS